MTKLSWPAVALIATLAAAALGLATLAHWDAGGIVGVLGVLAGIGGGAAVAGGVAAKVDDVHTETSRQTQTLDKIEHQTNGMSSAERQDIAERAAAAVLSRLRPGDPIR